MNHENLAEELKKHCEFATVGADGDVECECMCGRNIMVGCAYQKKDYNPDGIINVVFCTRLRVRGGEEDAGSETD